MSATENNVSTSVPTASTKPKRASRNSSGANLLSAPPQTIAESFRGTVPPPLEKPRVLLDGVDTAYISCFVSWGLRAAELFQKIGIAKEEGKIAGQQGMIDMGFPLGHCVVHPTGSRKADGPYYPYRISVDGYDIELRHPDHHHESIPDIVVKVGAVKCMQHGNTFKRVWRAVEDMLTSLGAESILGLPSRVDRMYDLGTSFTELDSAFKRNDIVCRGRTKDSYGKIVPNPVSYHQKGLVTEGFTIGSELKLRCYDKRIEMVKDADKAVMLQGRWGDYTGPVSRVEFQLRREALKCRGIITCEDLIRDWDKLSAYLIKSWCSFRLGAGQDRRNLSRKPLYACWQALRDHDTVEPHEPIAIVHSEHVSRRRKQWVDQILGCIISMAAEEGVEGHQGLLEVFEKLPELLVENGIDSPAEKLKARAGYRESKLGGSQLEIERTRRGWLSVSNASEKLEVAGARKYIESGRWWDKPEWHGRAFRTHDAEGGLKELRSQSRDVSHDLRHALGPMNVQEFDLHSEMGFQRQTRNSQRELR